MERLRQDGDLETGISPNFLIRNWPLAFRLQEQMRDQEQKETAYSDPNLLTIMKTIKLRPWPHSDFWPDGYLATLTRDKYRVNRCRQ